MFNQANCKEIHDRDERDLHEYLRAWFPEPRCPDDDDLHPWLRDTHTHAYEEAGA